MKIKKILFCFILATTVAFSIFFLTSPALADNKCVENYRSCDQDNPCCNFPSFTCQEGYCKPRLAFCGEYPYPCCDTPNPPCANGFICEQGYCKLPTTPTPTPSCGQHAQKCCSTQPGPECLLEGEICLMGTCMPDPQDTYEPKTSPTPIPSDTTNITCDSNKGVQTALGCIPTEPMDLVKWLFPYLLGFGGLAAFGLIVYSGFRLMTSSGDPQKIQGAKETITSAVTGLIFIILSLFLLRLIGVDILGLPGLE